MFGLSSKYWFFSDELCLSWTGCDSEAEIVVGYPEPAETTCIKMTFYCGYGGQIQNSVKMQSGCEYVCIYIYTHMVTPQDLTKWYFNCIYINIYIYTYIFEEFAISLAEASVSILGSFGNPTEQIMTGCHTSSQVVRDKVLRNHRRSCWYYINTHHISYT